MAKATSPVIISTLLTLCLTVGPISCANQFLAKGFTFIGNMSSDDLGHGTRSIGIKAISLYLSEPSDQQTQGEALQTCKLFDGQLLYILNKDQYEDVRVFTAANDAPGIYWTAGRYDTLRGAYGWVYPSVPVTSSFIRSDQQCQEAGTGYGLAVVGEMSSFGLCSVYTTSRFRYICRV